MTANARPTPRTISQAVAELRRTHPDVSASSLRFLERVGLLRPIRTAGGHRLYRPGDIARVRRIKEWQKRRLSLDEIRERLAAADRLVPASLCQTFLDQARRGDLAAAAQGILAADELGMSLESTFGEVLAPALIEVGEQWCAGALQIGQEHEISSLTSDLIAELTFRHAGGGPDHPAVVAACVADERHDLGLRIVTGLLRMAGVRVHFLGANVAPEILRESIALRRPAVVLLSATMPAHLGQIERAIEALGPEGDRPAVVAGGQACFARPEAVRALGAVVPVGPQPSAQIAEIVALIGTPAS